MAVNLLGSTNSAVNYGSVPANSGLTALSVAITIYPSALTGGRIATHWGATRAGQSWIISITDTDEIQFVVNRASWDNTANDFYGRKTTSLNISTSSLYRIVCTWAPSDIDIFVNGSSVASTVHFSNTVTEINDPSTDVRLGHQDGSDGIDGDYCEFALWSRKLDDNEALGISSGFSPFFYPRNCFLYDKLISTSSTDIFGGVSPTHTSTSEAAHPRIIYPSAQILQFPPTAAVGGPSVNINGSTVSWNGLTSYNWNGIA